MMNFIWGFMLLIGILFALANNSAAGFTDGLMSSCTDAVEFIISLAGVMAVWSGLMKIAERSELIAVISRTISPLMSYLFPEEKNSRTISPLMSYLFPEEKNSRTISMMIMSFMADICRKNHGKSRTRYTHRTRSIRHGR